jgi:RNA polymerase sigma-70 factor (ECF subfamily)
VAAQAGEPWAQEALFRRYAPFVNRLAYRIFGRDDRVDDLVQESFVQALSSLDRLDDPSAFVGWLRAVVVRTAGKMLRRRRLRMRLGLERSTPVDVDAVIARTAPPDTAAELRAVYSVLESLPTEERLALVLYRVEGFQLEDIAQQMDLSLATVKRRLKRAEEALTRAHGGLAP